MMTDTELAQHVLPEELMKLHRMAKDVGAVRALARDAVQRLAGADDFDAEVPRALMLLAMLDHLTDQRTSGMIADYLDF